MKIKLLFTILSFVAISCSNTKKIQKIELSHVDLDVFTSIAVKCDLFEKYFGHEIKNISLNPKKSEEFYIVLKEFVKRAETYSDIPDVRVKAKLLFTDGHYEEVCIGDNLILYKDIVYVIDDEFRNFIINSTLHN
jgi:hypothetical protein